MFKTGPLYLANLNSSAGIVVNQGGTSSGKTYAIDQVLATHAISEPNRIITIAGQDIPNLKVGAMRDMETIIDSSPELQSLLAKPFNKTERTYTFKSGSIIEFKSYDDAQDAKSGKRDYLFMNEANGFTFDVFSELHLRTRLKTYIDYNPNSTFWVHEKVIGQVGTELIISDHRHNPFLEQSQRDKIERLKDIDLDLWKVYARGMTGKIEGLVFRNWKVCDSIPDSAKYLGTGMDFGFTNDPTTVLDVFQQDGELWINERLYSTGLTNQDIAKRLEAENIPRRRGIIADSAEPKSIEELNRMGWYVEPAQKGADSINISISLLKNYRLNITKDSTNLRKELLNYKWKVDKATGNPINQPVDYYNHCLDALRYVALNKLLKSDARPKTFMPSR